MKRFTFAKLSRTLLLAAVVAVGSVCWLGCGGNEENPADNNGDNVGNNTGGDNGGDNGGVVDPDNVVNGTFTDNTDDGKTYKTVKIGKQTWMAENMSKKTANSWCLGEGGNINMWGDEKLTPSEVQANCNKYGRLYKWDAAKTVCPSGWRLPDSADWARLFTAVGGEMFGGATWQDAGTKLKAKSGWDDYFDWNSNSYKSGNGTDDYGFSALPGGGRAFSDQYSFETATYEQLYRYPYTPDGVGLWWTATQLEWSPPGVLAYRVGMGTYGEASLGAGSISGTIYDCKNCCKNCEIVTGDIIDYGTAYSVRCVKK